MDDRNKNRIPLSLFTMEEIRWMEKCPLTIEDPEYEEYHKSAPSDIKNIHSYEFDDFFINDRKDVIAKLEKPASEGPEMEER